MPHWVIKVSVALLFATSPAGCHETEEGRARHAAVQGCEAGMKHALSTPTREDAIRTFSRECAPVYEDPKCRSALMKPAPGTAENPLMIPLFMCRRVYCGALPSATPACRAEKIIGSDAVNRAWVGLSQAIFELEGFEDAERLGADIASFFVAVNARKPAKRIPATSRADVERCEQGVQRAVTLPTRREMLRTYYEECAAIYAEKDCSDAYRNAALAEPEDQNSVLLVGCRDAYCAWMDPSKVEACGADFVPTREAVERAWPPLWMAIVELEAKPYASDIARITNQLYGGLGSRPPG